MRVLHVIGSLIHGGAEAILYRLVSYPSDITHHVVSFGPPAHYSPLIAAHGVQVDHLGADTAAGKIASIGRLFRIIRATRPDVVQAWMYRSNVAAGLVARAAGVPSVWGVHCASFEGLPPGGKLWVYLSGMVANSVPNQIINCSSSSATIHERVGFRRSRTEIVPNGYDVQVFSPDAKLRSKARSEFGITPDIFLLGTVARWHPQKDHANLIGALAELNQRIGRGWRCLLVGPWMDGENQALRDLLRASGCGEQVILAGARSDVPDLMRALDLHVLPSAEEAFPNAVAEAMASATPCIATDVGDAALMIGDTGWVVPPRSPQLLASAIAEAHAEWQSDPSAWADRGARARRRVQDNFSLGLMVERYRKIWSAVAGAA